MNSDYYFEMANTINTVKINVERINHLLKLYGLTKPDFITKVGKGLKKPYSEDEVFSSEIKVSLLKKIDKIFSKGLSYYLDPQQVKENKEESIFFRKDTFNAELNFGSKKIVTHFEEEKISLSALSKMAGIKQDRILPVFTIRTNPKEVAQKIREQLYPTFTNFKRDFLKSLIAKFAENNILVFEFVETWNKKDKVNINGFYLSPETIVLKRNQNSFSREIFTLIHELGHYLLDEEEIDERINEDSSDYNSLNKIERWCNDFAYYFLIGDYDSTINQLETANAKNDYHHEILDQISERTNLSVFALYTRLLILNKISVATYRKIFNELSEKIKAREAEEKRKRELEKQRALEEGRKIRGSVAKPILSPLLISTVQSAFIEGVINEAEFCRRLSIKPDKIDQYI